MQSFLTMSLKRTLEKLPENIAKTRRGLFFAVEGPVCAQAEKIVKEIIPELDDPVVIQGCTPGAGFFELVQMIRNNQTTIETALTEGKAVIYYNYMLHALVVGVLANVFKSDEVQSVAAMRLLARQMDGCILPDRTFMFLPGVEVYAKRIQDTFGINADTDYMFSEYRREVDKYSMMSDFIDKLVVFRGDPISQQSDMLNMIVMDSFIGGIERKRFYFS